METAERKARRKSALGSPFIYGAEAMMVLEPLSTAEVLSVLRSKGVTKQC